MGDQYSYRHSKVNKSRGIISTLIGYYRNMQKVKIAKILKSNKIKNWPSACRTTNYEGCRSRDERSRLQLQNYKVQFFPFWLRKTKKHFIKEK